jgi:hypothetical protein
MKSVFVSLVVFTGLPTFALAQAPCESLKPVAMAWIQGTLGMDSHQFDTSFSFKSCDPRAGYFSDDEQPWLFTYESANQRCISSIITGSLRVDESRCFKK